VPQFLLEGFKTDGGGISKINVFDILRNSLRANQAIKEVFSQNYFYDKDNQIERFICDQIETPASKIIINFRKGDYSLLNRGGTELIKFICCQDSRTVEARQDALNFINAHMQGIFADIARFNDLDINSAKKLKMVPKNKDAMRSFTAERALDGVINSKGMEDLRFHLLENESDTEFVITDHPVSRYNWLYRDVNDTRVGSLLARGVQLFLPVSKRHYLCAYDPKVYKYGKKDSYISIIKDDRDVSWLNQLQVRNANSFVGFSGVKMKNYALDLIKKFKGKKIYRRNGEHLYEEEMSDGKIKTGYMVYTTQVKLYEKPNFFKILKKSRNFSNEVIERDPDISRALMMLKKHITHLRSEQ
jgi:hypothetical protein